MLIETADNIPDNSTRSVVDADDLSAIGRIKDLKSWWDNLISLGTKFAYFSQPSKSCFFYQNAASAFKDTKINISEDGKRHLGTAMGSKILSRNMQRGKSKEGLRSWESIVKCEPQTAFSCFVSGFKPKLTYLIRTILGISRALQQVNNLIQMELIPTITGGIKKQQPDVFHEKNVLNSRGAMSITLT